VSERQKSGGRSRQILSVEDALLSRRSVRAFLPTPVPRALLEELLTLAGRAPSGTNTQPWIVYVLQGTARDRLCAKILAAHNSPRVAVTHREEFPYYPEEWKSPYLDRRRKVGYDLYGLLGIGKGDKARMHQQLGRNYLFFDAPVGLICTMDRSLAQGSLLDYGMFLQSLMLAARARGLDSCPQAAFNRYHRIIREELQLPDDEVIVCAMALGYADPQAPENQLLTERAPLADWARFRP